jgi:hypothetical protein
MLPKGPSEQIEEVIGAIETHCEALDKAERLCEADEDVIPTMTRRQHGRGHRRPSSADARPIAACAVLALAALRCLRSQRGRRPCALRYPVGRRRIIRRAAHACTVHGLRTAWGEPSAPVLG